MEVVLDVDVEFVVLVDEVEVELVVLVVVVEVVDVVVLVDVLVETLVLVEVVDVEVVVGAESLKAGTQSSTATLATRTAGPKLVLLIETVCGANWPAACVA